MECVADRPAAEEHDLRLSRSVGLGRNIGAHPLHALPCRPRTSRTRCKPDSRNHRRTERQGSAKRGASIDPSGYDAGKKVTGRKRHILVDTLGLLLNIVVHPANVQDRDGARLVLNRHTRRMFPFVERIFADAGYQGAKLATAVAKTGTWKIEIVKRNELHRFVVLPKRWIVERTLAWISRFRRLAKDFERHARKAVAFIRLAMIRLMLRRLTAPSS
jgi:transposase